MALKWMEIAWSYMGEREVAAMAANPAILNFFRLAGHPEVKTDEEAWCAAFIRACLVQAGLSAEGSLMARSLLKIGTPITTPRYGAIAVISRGTDGVSGHVGFVVGWTKDTISLLGGNQGDAVSVAAYPISKLLGLRWPVDVTAKQLRGESRTVRAANKASQDISTATGLAVTGGGASLFTAGGADTITRATEKVAAVKGLASTAGDFLHYCLGHWPLVAAVAALYFGARALWSATLVKRLRAQDASTGAHQGGGDVIAHLEGN